MVQKPPRGILTIPAPRTHGHCDGPHAGSRCVLPTTLGYRSYYYPHSADEDTEAEKRRELPSVIQSSFL